jgi:hypothetical protein
MGHMEEAPARPSYGQEEGHEAVGNPSSLMMIREVGRMEVDILVCVVVVSCLTMKAEGHQAVVGMKVAAHLVQVVGF